MNDQWLIDAIIHLSHQVRRVEQKVDLILSQQDFSKEDLAVLGMTEAAKEATKTVEEALGKIPTQTKGT